MKGKSKGPGRKVQQKKIDALQDALEEKGKA